MVRFRNAFGREQCHDKMDCPDSGKGIPELVLGASGLMPISGQSVSLQTAFLNEARPDRRNVRLAVAQRLGRRMDRVVAEDEIVRVWRG